MPATPDCNSPFVSKEQVFTDCGHKRGFSAYREHADRFPPTVEGLCPGCRNLAVNLFGVYNFNRGERRGRLGNG